MHNKQNVSTTRKISWFTLIAFFVFSVVPFPGQAAVIQSIGVDGRIIYTTDVDTDWDVANFDQVAGAVWEFNLLNGNLNVNVNSDHATTWAGKTDIFGPGILGIFNRMGFHTTSTAEINLHNADFIGAAMRLTDQGTLNSLKLQGDANGGYALNEGKVSGIGNVAFLGRAVENKGTIDLPLNKVTLGAGDAITVGLSGDNLVSVVIDEATSQDVFDYAGNDLADQIKNGGNITGHKITIDAKGIDSVFEKAINLKGEIKAVDVDTNDRGELALMSIDDIYSSATLKASKIYIRSQMDVATMGIMRAQEMDEAAASFEIGGTYEVEHSHHNNLDHAITYAANTSVSGTIGDIDNIIFNSGVTVTLSGNTNFNAGTDGSGAIQMNAASAIAGGGYNLGLSAAGASSLGSISGVGTLTFSSATGSDVTFTSPSAATFSVGTVKTNYHSLLARDVTDGSGNHLIYSDSNVVGGLQYINTNATTLGYNYKMVNNIDATETSSWNSGAGIDGFNAIGNSASKFTGDFDGQNYTISNLFIDRSSTDYIGLFGYANGAAIQNVQLTGVDITGRNDVGGLVGYNYSSSISNSSTTGSVNGASIIGGLVGYNYGNSAVSNSHSTSVVVSAGGQYAGGLVGKNEGSSISNSYATSSVSSAGGLYVGGLTGFNYTNASISRSYATGAVSGQSGLGGLSGGNSTSSSITDSYATGNVTGTWIDVGGLSGDNVSGSTILRSYATGNVSAVGQDVGGLVGLANNTGSTIADSYATGSVTGGSNVGGLVGILANGASAPTNSYFTDNSHGSQTGKGTYESGGASAFQSSGHAVYSGWDFNGLWKINSSQYPHLIWQDMSGGGTASNPWQIDNVNKLQFMSYALSDDFILTGDIDASTTSTWNSSAGFNPVGNSSTKFTGTFDGDGHTISGLTINRSGTDYVGLFGYGNGSTIQNVGLLNVNITGHYFVGGLIGLNDMGSGIANSYASGGTINGTQEVGGLVGTNNNFSSIDNSHASSAVHGTDLAGGLVGSNRESSSITNSYASGTVSGTSTYTGGLAGLNFHSSTVANSYASGVVSGVSQVGGLVGDNETASIANSYATGAVSGSGTEIGGLVGTNFFTANIANSYATGAVSGGNYVGGLAGRNLSSTIVNSYSTGVASGSSIKGGLLGYYDSGTLTNNWWFSSNTSGIGFGSASGVTKASAASDFYSSSHAVYQNSQPSVGDNSWDFSSTWIDFGADYPALAFEYNVWTGSGNWSNAANWSQGLPGATSKLLFNATSFNNASIDASFGGSAAQIFITSGYSGTITANHSLTLSGGYVQAAGLLDANGYAVTIGGLAKISGGEYRAKTATQTFNGGLTVSGGTFTGAGGAVDVNGNVTQTGGTLTAPSGSFTVSGDWTRSAGTFTAGAGTVTFDGSADNLSINTNQSFNNLTITKSTGTVNLGSNLDVNGNLIQGGNLDTINHDMTVAGNWTRTSGGFTEGNGTVTLDGSGAQLVTTNQQFNNLTITKTTGTVTLGSNIDVNGNLTQDGNLDGTAYTINLAGDWTRTLGTFTAGTGTVTLDGAGAQSVTTNQSFNNFNIAKTTGTVTLGNDLDVNGFLVQTGGNFDSASHDINIAGNWIRTGGTFTAGTGTVIFDGVNQFISGSTTFYNFTKSDTTNDSTSRTLTFGAGSTTTVNGLLTLTGQDSDDRVLLVSSTPGSARNLIANGTFNINYAGVTDSNATGGLKPVSTNTQNNGGNSGWFGAVLTWVGSVNANFGLAGNWDTGTAPTVDDSIVINNVTNDPIFGADFSFKDLTINSNGILDLNGHNLTLTGTFLNSGTLKLNGNETLAGVTNSVNSGTIEYTGAGTYASLAAGNNYFNLLFSGNGNFTAASNLDINGNFAQSAGTFIAPGQIDLAGDWIKTGGAFTPGTGTVNFDAGSGTQTLNSGGSSFKNITHSGAGTLQVSTNDLSVTGTLTNSAGTFDAGRNVSITGLTTISNNTTYQGSTGTNTFSGGLDMTGGTVSTIGGGSVVLGGNVTTNASASTATISGNLDLGGATRTFATADGAAAMDLEISAVMSNGGVTKAGNGTTVVSGANTYSGTTTISAGTLQVGNNASGATGRLGDGTGGVVDNAALVFNRTGTLTVDNAISGTGTLTQAGAGTTTLTGANNYSGTTTISAGILQVGNGGTAGTLGTGAVTDNAALAINRSDAVTVSNAISGTGTFTQAGVGTTTLTGANNYSGTTTISAGTLQVGNGGTAGTLGTGTVTDNAALAINRSDAVTVSNAISGTGTLTQAGAGTTTLTGTNNYSGTTTISAGTLQVGNGGTAGTLGTGALTNNTSLVINRSDAVTVSNAISGTGTLTQAGAGTTTLTGANNYSGTTTISAGTLQVGSGGTAGTLGTGTVTDNAALTIDRSDAVTVANAISGTGALTQAGAGTTTLTGANNYSGTTTISAGILQVGNGGTAGTLGTGAVTDNAALAINRSDAVTVSNAISGTGTLTQAGAGTTTLTGANNYSGTTTISAGTLQVGSGGTAGTLGTGTVTDNAALTINRSDAVTVSNAISGTGTLTQAGAGTTTLTGANNYSGATTISAGTLQVGNGGTAGTLGTGTVTDNAALTINRSDAVTVSNAISGTGTFTQAGAGTTTLTGANSYSGITNVNAGVLNAQNNSALGSAAGGTTVASGAALELQGGINIGNETLTLNGNGISNTGALRSISGNNTVGGTVNLASDTTIGVDANQLTLNGILNSASFSLTKVGAGTLALNNTVTLGGDLVVSAGTIGGSGDVTVNGGDVTGNGTINMNYGNFTVAGTGNFGGNTNWRFNDLTFNGAGTTTKIGSGNITVSDDFAINAGHTFNASNNSNDYYIGGDWTNAGTFNAGNSTVILNGGAANITSGGDSFYGLASQGFGTVTLLDDLHVTNNFAHSGTTFNANGKNVTIGGYFINSNSGTYTNSTGGSTTIGGNLFNSSGGTINNNGSTTTVNGTTTVSSGTYNTGTGTQTFNGALTVSGTGTVNGSNTTGTMDINSSLTIATGGTLNGNNETIQVSGNWNNTGGNFVSGTSTVVLDGTGAQNVTGGGDSFYGLTHTGSGTMTLQDNINANTFSNPGGTLIGNGNAITLPSVVVVVVVVVVPPVILPPQAGGNTPIVIPTNPTNSGGGLPPIIPGSGTNPGSGGGVPPVEDQFGDLNPPTSPGTFIQLPPTNSGTGTPGNPGTGTSGNSGTGTPGNPGSGAPGNPGNGTLEHPGSGTPGAPTSGDSSDKKEDASEAKKDPTNVGKVKLTKEEMKIKSLQEFFNLLLRAFGFKGKIKETKLSTGRYQFDAEMDELYQNKDLGISEFQKMIFDLDSESLDKRKKEKDDEETQMILKHVNGNVKVITKTGKIYNAVNNQTLRKGDQVWTANGATAELKTSTGQVEIKQGSAVSVQNVKDKITGEEKSLLALALGGLNINSTKSNFIVQAPQGISGLRG